MEGKSGRGESRKEYYWEMMKIVRCNSFVTMRRKNVLWEPHAEKDWQPLQKPFETFQNLFCLKLLMSFLQNKHYKQYIKYNGIIYEMNESVVQKKIESALVKVDDISVNQFGFPEERKDLNTENMKILQEFFKNEKEEHEKNDTIQDHIPDKDLQNLLLYYMKLTFEQRKKNSESVEDIFDEPSADLNDYSVSTDYDTEDEENSPKITLPSLKCNQCSKILRGVHSLKNHCMRKHGNHEKKNVLCDKCPTRFYTDFEFNRHYQTHYSVKNYLCHLCSKKFFQKSSLELHLRYHKNDRRYQCDTCRKKFFTNNHLKRHLLTHTNQRDFKCEPCDRSFRYKDHLRRHLQSVHIGIRSHNCGECHKSFMYLSQLRFHEQSHAQVPFKCKDCKQIFNKRSSLKLHQKQCK